MIFLAQRSFNARLTAETESPQDAAMVVCFTHTSYPLRLIRFSFTRLYSLQATFKVFPLQRVIRKFGIFISITITRQEHWRQPCSCCFLSYKRKEIIKQAHRTHCAAFYGLSFVLLSFLTLCGIKPSESVYLRLLFDLLILSATTSSYLRSVLT